MEKRSYFEIKKALNDKFYFVLRAKNAEVICTSQLYETLQGAEKGIRSIRCNALFAKIKYKL